MIRYDLCCEKGHEFDGWFQGSAAFDTQAEAGLLACPRCGGTKIEKALMTPGLPVKANARRDAVPTREVEAPADPAPGPLAPDPRQAALREAVRQLHSKVRENAEYVGDRFADEARRIYYADTPERGIYGEATVDDAKALHEEGIEVLPLPNLPDDQN